MNTLKLNKKIIKIGSLLKANNKGYFVSDLKSNLIQNKWKLPLKNAINIIRKNIPEIKSIYVRGSVATGKAIDYVSDVDLFVITSTQTKDVYKNIVYVLLNDLNKYFPYIKRFDIGYYTNEEIVRVKERVLVKLRSVLVFGKDISRRIPKLKPGKDVCVTLPGLKKEIRQTLLEINNGYYNKKNTKPMCTWIMKRLVRGGLELVSDIERAYSRDLYICYELFSSYYPNYSHLSYESMKLAIYPNNDLNNIKKTLIDFGGFLIKESKRKGII